MKLELRRSGGIAGSIRRRPLVLETDGLDDQQCARLNRAVAAARERGSAPPSRPSDDTRRSDTLPTGGADLMQYRVRVESPAGLREGGSGAETFTFSDPVDDPALGALLDLITELGNEQTGEPRTEEWRTEDRPTEDRRTDDQADQ